MAEANQQQQQQVDPAVAREFLTGLGHQADTLKTMGDPDVVKIYTAANETIAKHAPKVVPFGEKWREALAGEDKDDMATLGRFQDPKALWGRTKELTKKLSSGELKAVTPFPAKGTAEEQAAWRKDNGVPDAPEKYDIKLDNNLVVGEDDKPMVDGFLKYAHSNNWNNDQAKQALQWYFGEYMQGTAKAQAQADGEFRQQAQAALAADWGADYKRNITAVTNFLARAPESIRGLMMQGRLADGSAFGDHPEVLKWMASVELSVNPHTALTGPEGADSMKNIKGRIKEIEGMMGTDKYVKDEKVQQEYRDLIDARDRATQRGQAKS